MTIPLLLESTANLKDTSRLFLSIRLPKLWQFQYFKSLLLNVKAPKVKQPNGSHFLSSLSPWIFAMTFITPNMLSTTHYNLGSQSANFPILKNRAKSVLFFHLPNLIRT